jgi:multidrug efflux pump subunit AcrA (membrane-fusion protein)
LPETFVNVEIEADLGQKLVVSRDAVLDSGLEQRVFVDKGNGYFEPRKVKLGARTESDVEVLSGVAAGERVVTSGNFLIDSEARLKSTLGN